MTSTFTVLRHSALAIGIALAFAACSSNDDSLLIQQSVSASAGGTFSADAQGVSVVVPAGALSADAELTVRAVADSALPSGGAFAAADFNSDAVEVSLVGAGGIRRVAANMGAPVALYEVGHLGAGFLES